MLPIVPLALGLLTLPGPPPTPADKPEPLDVVSALETAVADAIEKAEPSVVAITRIKGKSGETLAIRGRNPNPPEPRPEGVFIERNNIVDVRPDRPGFPRPTAPEYYALPGDMGAGVVVGDDSQILTTYHLLKGSERIRVRAPGVHFDAEILAADPRLDLAVIAPAPGFEPQRPLTPIPLGDSSRLRQGAFLVALGNPYNAARDGHASASLGILSNTARRIEAPAEQLLNNPNVRQFFRYQPTLLQLDSKLNLGMSGGAVVNLRGELVGVTTSLASPSGFDVAAGYAIPMDALGRRAVKALVQGREVEYGFIGIGLDNRVPNMVNEVKQGTPAWKADLASGDTILAVGDVTLTDDESSLPLALAGAPVGEPVTLKVLHDGQVKTRTLVMSKYPVMGEVIATSRPDPWRGAHIDFTSVLTSGQNTESTLEAMTRGGVGIIDVDPGTPAARARLSRGMIVTRVEDKPVSTPSEFRDAVARLDGKPVTLQVVDGISEEKPITVPAE